MMSLEIKNRSFLEGELSNPLIKQKTFEKASIASLPHDILIMIFSKSGVAEFGHLMQVSKFFYKYQNNQECWKNVTLKENPEIYDQFPILKTISNRKINWKKVCKDVGINVERWKGDDFCHVIPIWEGTRICNKEKFSINSNSDILTIKNLKKIIIKISKLNCKHSDFLLKTLSERFESHDFSDSLPEDLIVKNIEIPKNSFYYEQFVDKSKNNILFKGFIEKELESKEQIEDWILDDDNQKCRCNCILF